MSFFTAVKLKAAGENTLMTDAIGSLKPDYTASQHDRQRTPVTFVEPKYRVAELCFWGLY